MGQHDELLARLDKRHVSIPASHTIYSDAAAAIRELLARDASPANLEPVAELISYHAAKIRWLNDTPYQSAGFKFYALTPERDGLREVEAALRGVMDLLKGKIRGEEWWAWERINKDAIARALAPERTVAGQEPYSSQTAKQRYDYCTAEDKPESPLEALRFFCSLTMNGQDWLDVEPFFDALTADAAAPASPLLPGLEPVAYIVYFGEDYRLYRDRCDAEYGINCYSRAGHITSMHPLYALSNAEISRLKGEGSES